MDVYDRIDKILAEKRMSRRKLAQQICVAPSTFQSMMARKRGMTFEILMKITEQLKISSNDFYKLDEPDREYEMICDQLEKSGLSIEETGFNSHNGPDGDTFYIWHIDSEAPEEDRVELEYAQILDIIKRVEHDADIYRRTYTTQRYEAELFSWPHRAKLPEHE